eukprot:928116-Amphidinium_carterae.1
MKIYFFAKERRSGSSQCLGVLPRGACPVAQPLGASPWAQPQDARPLQGRPASAQRSLEGAGTPDALSRES